MTSLSWRASHDEHHNALPLVGDGRAGWYQKIRFERERKSPHHLTAQEQYLADEIGHAVVDRRAAYRLTGRVRRVAVVEV